MKIGVPKEIFEGENRVAMTPDSAKLLQKLGYECIIETKAGLAAGFSDTLYKEAGVEIAKTAAALWKEADIIAKVRQPNDTELKRLNKDKTLISFFNPGGNDAGMDKAKKSGANVIAMEMVPRISRAQKMDALSSMANIAGYRAVIEAGNNFGRFFTGQVTAAGKVPPPKFWWLGLVLLALQRLAPRPRWGPSPTPLTCGLKWQSRWNQWALNSSISISKRNNRMARPRAVMRPSLARVPRSPIGQIP